MQQSIFFNTADLDRPAAEHMALKAGTQNARVLDIYKTYGKPLTPAEAHRIYCRQHPEAPIISIRRAVTQLTDKGLLRCTGQQKPGNYHIKNKTWVAVDQNITTPQHHNTI